MIDGGVVFAGGTVTTLVWGDVATVADTEFVAVTCTRIVLPASRRSSVYVEAVAFAMLTQFAPDVSHRRHW